MLSDMLCALSKSSFYSLRRRSGGGREGRQLSQACRRKHRLLIEFEVGYRKCYTRIQNVGDLSKLIRSGARSRKLRTGNGLGDAGSAVQPYELALQVPFWGARAGETTSSANSSESPLQPTSTSS
jgi:hypothetical protein